MSYKGVPQEHKSVQQECPTRVPHKSEVQDCRTRVSDKTAARVAHTRVPRKSDIQELSARVPRKSVPKNVHLQECPTRVSAIQESDKVFRQERVLQECLARVWYKSVPRVFCKCVLQESQECPTSVSAKSVGQECPTKLFHKSVPQEWPTRVSHQQEWLTRVSYKSVVSCKSVPQQCAARVPTRVSYESAPQECPTRVSHKGE